MSSASTTADSSHAVECIPNITEAGRQRRIRSGYAGGIAAVLIVLVAVALRAAWFWRALVFLPAAVSAFGFLQARRNTCVMRAREGTIEHDDFSTSPAPPAELAASRRVAAGINRDAVLIAAGAAVVAMATALVR